MYLFDPSQGRRRRKMLLDKLEHYQHVAARLLGKAQRDLRNRVIGLRIEARKQLELAPAQPDADTLVARVRSKLGRYVSHPHAVTVQVHQGRVTLAGPILENEAKPLIRAIERVTGVTEIDNQLELHDCTEKLPALQSGARRGGEPPELLQRSWTPSLQVGAGAAALGLIVMGLRRRSLAPLALPIGGAVLLRALFDRPLLALFGGGSVEDGFTIRKTLRVKAPPEQVFALISAFERFPMFMPHVQNVERSGDSRYRWTLRGTAGSDVQFESEIIELIPEQRITLGHVGDRHGEHFASIRFEPSGELTRVHIEIRYQPRLGVIGVAATKLLGLHPKRVLDADLLIMKALLEQGRTRVGGRQITLTGCGATVDVASP
jgi:uncharacterized membrane protein